MCTSFFCTVCSLCYIDHCKHKPAEAEQLEDQQPPPNPDSAIVAAAKESAVALPGSEKECPGITPFDSRKKCETCIRLRGATKKLELLVFHAPFMVTDGLAGLEKVAAWERKGVEKMLRGRKRGWDDKAESRAERRKVQERMEKMGLVGAGVVDGRKEHQGFDMSVTPPKEDTKEEEEEGDGWW